MRSERARFFKNAASNIVNGTSSAVFAIALPYFFVRYFTRTEFGIWILVLQLAAYVNYLNFGVQTAIGRYISHALEVGNQPQAERILTAGVQILSLLALFGFSVIAGLACSFPWMFHQVAPQLVPTARSALLWVGSALAIGLPFSAFLGAFIGLQRNGIPAAMAAVSKTILAVILIVTAARSRDLRIVAEVYFIGSTISYLLQYGAFIRVCRGWSLRIARNVAAEIRELTSYCASLIVWFLAMFLVNGIDTTIVGFFDFRMVAAYGAAISIVSFFAGVIQALMAPLIQVFVKLQARGETYQMMRLLHLSSFGCTLFLLTSAAWLIALSKPAFNFWVGPAIAKDAIPLFDILVIANALRNSAVPYANYLVATGQQRRVVLGPIAEGLTNLTISLVGAHYFGALGVALGTFVGAVMGVGVNYVYNFRRTTFPTASIYQMMIFNFAKPLLLASPILIALGVQMNKLVSSQVALGMIILASLPAAVVGYRQLHSVKMS